MKTIFSMIIIILLNSSLYSQSFSEAPEKWTIPVKIINNAIRPFINWNSNKLYYHGYNGWNYLIKTDTGWSEPIQLDSNILNIPYPSKLVISPNEKTLYITATTYFKIYRCFWNDSLGQWGPASILLDNGINSGGVAWEVSNLLNDTTMILQGLCGTITYFDSVTSMWSAPLNFPCNWCAFCVDWGAWVSPIDRRLYSCRDTYTLGRGKDLCVEYMGSDSNYQNLYSLNISFYMDSLYQLGEISGNNELFLTLAPDGRTMYFSANYDTLGRYDLYETKMFIDENGDTVLTDLQDIETNTIPEDFYLYPNYPNPFNPSTRISYSIPEYSKIIVKIFDILGNEIETLVNEEKPSGSYDLTWNATGLPSGVYFYQLRAGGYVKTKKMILIR